MKPETDLVGQELESLPGIGRNSGTPIELQVVADPTNDKKYDSNGAGVGNILPSLATKVCPQI